MLVIPVAVSHGVNSSDFVVYSTDNSTTVCQGRYWFLESGSDSEGRSYFERHVFVHVVAIIYLILCALSLAPNLAVIVRLNQSMYRTIQRTLSKSSSQLSTQDTTFSNSDLEEKDEAPDLVSPLRCYDMMKPTCKANSPQANVVVIPSTARKTSLCVKSGSDKVMLNKKLSLGDVCKSLSSSILQSESSARSGIKTSPSLASLSTAAFSAAVSSGSAPISTEVKGVESPDNAAPSVKNLPTPIVRAPSRQRFQATVKSSIKKVSMANTFIIRNQLAVKKTEQVKLRKRRQRSIVITLIIMCLVCLMSSGLYGVAVFSVNLREHHHDSLLTMYVTFYAPFLMFAGMVTIPVIHYWRNAKLKAYVDQQCSAIVLKICPSRKHSGIADPLKKI